MVESSLTKVLCIFGDTKSFERKIIHIIFTYFSSNISFFLSQRWDIMRIATDLFVYCFQIGKDQTQNTDIQIDVSNYCKEIA